MAKWLLCLVLASPAVALKFAAQESSNSSWWPLHLLELGEEAFSSEAAKGLQFLEGAEDCTPVHAVLTNSLMKTYCSDPTSLEQDFTETARACDDASTPFVQRALANKMFSHCGSWCIYDYDKPDKVAFGWDKAQKCFKEGDAGCLGHPEKRGAIKRKKTFCETDICHPTITKLTVSLMHRYCGTLSVSGEDLGPKAVGCEDRDTVAVRKALANQMFDHCGAWCLFDFDKPADLSWGWYPEKKCWSRGGCQGHPEQEFVVKRKSQSCELTTTTTTTTSTSTTTTSTVTSTTITTTSTVTSTSTTTTSTVTSTTTTSTSTVTTTSTTVTSTTTSTSTTTTSTSTVTSTTTTKTSTTTSTTLTTTSTITSTTTTSTSTSTSTTTTSTSTTTTVTSTTTSTSTTTTSTSTVTSTTTTSTSTTTATSTTTTVTTTITTTVTTTTTTSTTTTSTSTTSTSTTTLECLMHQKSKITNAIMKSYCGNLSFYHNDLTEKAVSCESATTPFVRQSLANFMFNHCGSWCLYDFEKPSEISYQWDMHEKCYRQNSHCAGHVQQDLVVHRKTKLCEADICIPQVFELTDSVAARYCPVTEKTQKYRPAQGKACDEGDTAKVQKALANKMFSHCGAWCLWDFDEPAKVAYGWNPTDMCWSRGGCTNVPKEQAAAVERKGKFCQDA